jgi:hypothetical protein
MDEFRQFDDPYRILASRNAIRHGELHLTAGAAEHGELPRPGMAVRGPRDLVTKRDRDIGIQSL